MSVIEEESRLQMHNEGRQHQGYLKIRNKLLELKEKQGSARWSGYDCNIRKRSRSRDNQKRNLDKNY